MRQYTLLNLGVDVTLPREQWPDLTKRIEGILGGQPPLFDIDGDIEQLAQEYASRIVLSWLNVDDSDSVDYREVLLVKRIQKKYPTKWISQQNSLVARTDWLP